MPVCKGYAALEKSAAQIDIAKTMLKKVKQGVPEVDAMCGLTDGLRLAIEGAKQKMLRRVIEDKAEKAEQKRLKRNAEYAVYAAAKRQALAAVGYRVLALAIADGASADVEPDAPAPPAASDDVQPGQPGSVSDGRVSPLGENLAPHIVADDGKLLFSPGKEIEKLLDEDNDVIEGKESEKLVNGVEAYEKKDSDTLDNATTCPPDSDSREDLWFSSADSEDFLDDEEDEDFSEDEEEEEDLDFLEDEEEDSEDECSDISVDDEGEESERDFLENSD